MERKIDPEYHHKFLTDLKNFLNKYKDSEKKDLLTSRNIAFLQGYLGLNYSYAIDSLEELNHKMILLSQKNIEMINQYKNK